MATRRILFILTSFSHLFTGFLVGEALGGDAISRGGQEGDKSRNRWNSRRTMHSKMLSGQEIED